MHTVKGAFIRAAIHHCVYVCACVRECVLPPSGEAELCHYQSVNTQS